MQEASHAEEPLASIVSAEPLATNAVRRCVYVIDDDSQMRTSLHFLLGSCSIDAWPFAACTDFIDQLPKLAPAPILLDIRMPGIDGLQMLELLKERAVTWPVIIMTAHGDVSVAVRAMKLGAIDFLEKPFPPDALDHMLAQAFDILDGLNIALRTRTDALRRIKQLSMREREIIAILMEGVTNKTIAQRLGISPRTVEMHRGNAFAKLGLKSIAEVMALIVAAHLDLTSLKAEAPKLG
ncbi:MAG: response regulator [Novosphingobium sp.]|uniref:response regulator transcription factor n=1 Tax=Novosphingobium sp. TaxID=1874826 RepID=UPI0027349B2D|nr:response regulator [Novosphingobium sp.]MDP3551947.1 response regulator [Novosphingobium sp.]